MPPGMPDTCVKHIRRNMRPCLPELPGEPFDAENCLQLLGALLQNRLAVFSGTGLCDVPRSNISHTEQEQAVATPVLRLFGRAQGISIGNDFFFCWRLRRLCAWSRSQSLQSRMVGGAIANKSFDV